MKIKSKLPALLISVVFIIVSVFSTAAFATNGKSGENRELKGQFQVKMDKEIMENKAGENQELEQNKELEKNQEWKEAREKLEAEKDTVEQQKDTLEAQKEALEAQYEQAEAAGNAELAAQLKAQLETANRNLGEYKQQMLQIRMQMKEVVRNKYTQEELAQLQAVSDEIAASAEDVTVLPVENIIVKDKDVKFDTPPVVKYNRTLVPVRALTEAFGAQVQWLQDEKKVIITRGDTVIELQLDSRTTYVNGVETPIDVPAESMNNRTMVPLRFIVEKLGFKIDWDEDTGVVEVEDGTETSGTATSGATTETTGAGAAIDTTTPATTDTTAPAAQ